MKKITSPTNPTVKRIKKLRDRKYRELENAYLIEGSIILEDAMRNGEEVLLIGVNAASETEYRFLDNVETVEISPEIFTTLTDMVAPKDVIAIVKKRERPIVADKNRYIILDELQDPGNVGTIIRTAEAAGFTEIIALKGTVDIYSSKVVRAAAGSLFRIGIRQSEKGESIFDELSQKGIAVYACDSGGSVEYNQASLGENIGLIVGNEGNGISDFFLKNAQTLMIPMKKEAESLNVAVAAAIVIYESVRQGGI